MKCQLRITPTTQWDNLGVWTFGYDEENRLTQVNKPGGLTINYKYDGLGRRLQRTTSAGADERYVYDGSDVLLDLNADWTVANTYLSGPGIDNHLRQTSTTTGVSYYLNDHLSSTAALTDSSGSLLEQLTYDGYGNSAGSSRTRYGFTRRERDPDTGMLYATTAGTQVLLTYRTTFAEGDATEQFVFFVSGNDARLFKYNIESPLLITK